MRQALEPLSPEQARFGDDYKAYVGMKAARGNGVFFYSEDAYGVNRWLVDQQGQVLDTIRFSTRRA